MKKLKKNKPLIYLLAILSIFVVGRTFAYYLEEVSLPNRFKTMTYNIKLEEDFHNQFGTKKVTIKNEEATNTPVVIRVNFTENWSKVVEGTTKTLSNTINGQSVVTKNYTSDFNNDFELKDDGWYYYKKTLDSQKAVTILNSIALNESLVNGSVYSNEYHTYNYELDVNYEAVQADSKAINNVWGKTATINNGAVTWAS